MNKVIKNTRIVSGGRITEGDVLVRNGYIERVEGEISNIKYAYEEVIGEGLVLMPGVIDDQVHFREPGLTQKADIHSEARAAVAGGVTSFMEMPNTKPQSITQALLEEKYVIASRGSLANYSFYMGATNDNVEELIKTNKNNVCGIKVFMGASTGNMLVDSEDTLDKIFSACDHLIAIHSEDEKIIRQNMALAQANYGDNIPMHLHPEIRSVEACYHSTDKAVRLANKYNTRLHILHISTAEELSFFTNKIALENKRITSEVCVHHLWFDSNDYEKLGGLIKCNPAIKEARHKKALMEALLNDTLDIIATDHAPHTWDEKQGNYVNCPSGLPLVQHPLLMMLEFYKEGNISLEKIVEKMCHAPASCFKLRERGYIAEGYKADMVLVNLNEGAKVNKENIYYKCGWSPMEGYYFSSSIETTFVNGNKVYHKGSFNEAEKGERLMFN